jgi:hypothetical protein
LNGLVFEKRNEVCYATGNGNVYPTHPGLSTVINRSLYALDGTGYLRGLYADVRNSDGTRAYSASHSFNYSSSDKRFDEVNVYYHIHRYRSEYLQTKLGFNNFGQKRAYVRATASPGPNNAWYSRATGYLHFGPGTGSGFKNFAHEDKVIYHEYTHAVNHSIVTLNYGANESGAIEEGLSDYFPASFTNRTVILEYAAPVFKRNLTNPAIVHYNQYLESSKQQHIGGEFFSAALWDIRSHPSISISKADGLIYGAIYRITSNATFLSFREAVIVENQTMYGGSGLSTIENVFANRGIGPPALSVSISGPNLIMPQQQSTFTASVIGGSGSFSYSWFWNWGGSDIPIGSNNPYVHITVPWSETGKTFTLKLNVTDLQSGSVRSSQKSIKVWQEGDPIPPQSIAEFEIADIPSEFMIADNYPNPFNPSTTIRYDIPSESRVTLTIYDILGREIQRLVDGVVEPGYHVAVWDGRGISGSLVASGVYIYRFNAFPVSGENDSGGIQFTKKMIYTK